MAMSSIADGGVGVGAKRRSGRSLAFAYLLVLLTLLGAGGFIIVFGKASDGDPVATLDIAPLPQRHAAKPPPVQQAQSDTNLIAAGPPPLQPTQTQPGQQQALAQQPSQTTKPLPLTSQAPPAQTVAPTITRAVYAGAALVADPALIESTPNGPLPRIADDGRTPLAVYAPPVVPDKRPRVAIVVSGLGISARMTAQAIASLPPQVTLSFAPYAGDVQHWVSEARRRGHEVLLEVPMEPFDFPDSDPGPHTLRASVAEDSNIERLTWSMTRFTGYVGVTNLLGGRFLADPEALEPVMTYLTRRGLMFFDSGTATRSAAPDVAHGINAPFVESSVTVDTIQTGMEIDRRLTELEARARTNGRAAGTGFIYPVTIERIQNWAQGLPERGLVLVPVSAIVPGAN
jgi:polysaccharide deacetylase 2 family uncharacterized protein YibQ